LERGTLIMVNMALGGGVLKQSDGKFVCNIGSQFMILTGEMGDVSSDRECIGVPIGKVVEDDDDVLSKLDELYCDPGGRPYVDVRLVRMLTVYDPFASSDALTNLEEKRRLVMEKRGVRTALDGSESPTYEKPPEEIVEKRITAADLDDDDGSDSAERIAKRAEEIEKKEAQSRAVVLEMLGDLPSADIKAPENVLFVCKLNPVTDDEDLELIFSRFDDNAKADIIRDQETNDSLCYAFIEFTTKEQCTEAYFKMNNALIDDRRIKVDFSQSVSHIWNRFSQQFRGKLKSSSSSFPRDPYKGIQDKKSNHNQAQHRRFERQNKNIKDNREKHDTHNDSRFRERYDNRRDRDGDNFKHGNSHEIDYRYDHRQSKKSYRKSREYRKLKGDENVERRRARSASSDDHSHRRHRKHSLSSDERSYRKRSKKESKRKRSHKDYERHERKLHRRERKSSKRKSDEDDRSRRRRTHSDRKD